MTAEDGSAIFETLVFKVNFEGKFYPCNGVENDNHFILAGVTRCKNLVEKVQKRHPIDATIAALTPEERKEWEEKNWL